MNADNADEVIIEAALVGSDEIGLIPDKKHSIDSDEEDDAAKHKKKHLLSKVSRARKVKPSGMKVSAF